MLDSKTRSRATALAAQSNCADTIICCFFFADAALSASKYLQHYHNCNMVIASFWPLALLRQFQRDSR